MPRSYTHGEYDFHECKGCRYIGSLAGYVPVCNYIACTGRSRGCPIGKDCTRKEKGEPIRDPFGDDLGFGWDYE